MPMNIGSRYATPVVTPESEAPPVTAEFTRSGQHRRRFDTTECRRKPRHSGAFTRQFRHRLHEVSLHALEGRNIACFTRAPAAATHVAVEAAVSPRVAYDHSITAVISPLSMSYRHADGSSSFHSTTPRRLAESRIAARLTPLSIEPDDFGALEATISSIEPRAITPFSREPRLSASAMPLFAILARIIYSRARRHIAEHNITRRLPRLSAMSGSPTASVYRALGRRPHVI